MKDSLRRAAAGLAACLLLTACAQRAEGGALPSGSADASASGVYLSIARYETGNVDPQCSADDDTIALNVFDRLVEMETEPDGTARIVPSLAESWQVSDDGLAYTFRLRRGVAFSDGSPLTASDVRYSLTRLLTHPESCYREIAQPILGAAEVSRGDATLLRGVSIRGDLELTVTLSEPYAPFLASLSSPGASILEEEAAERAGRVFGREPTSMIGTGPFIFESWKPGLEMTLRANPDCWSGAPRCAGIRIHIVSDSESQRLLFENGTLDILDLDDLGVDAEYYFHGDIYRDLLRSAPRASLDFIALNNAVAPFDDVRVRRAMQLALDRDTLLTAIAGGRGEVENGLFPRGLAGHDSSPEPLSYEPEEARRLLDEAGLAEGFDVRLTLPRSASRSMKELLAAVAAMWERVGVRAEVVTVEDSVFLAQRNAGQLSCYAERWSAGYNDPDYFIYPYFGTAENSARRSICYGDEQVMARIRRARGLKDERERMDEYRALERKIVQEDAACIPLYSAWHCCIVSERAEGFRMLWNGSSGGCYRDMTLNEE